MQALIFMLIFLFASNIAFAAKENESKSPRESQKEEMPSEMPEVVVKASKPQQSVTVPNIETARQAINRTAGGVGIVDAEEYKKGRASTLQETLGYQAGVFVQPRFGSEEARLSIRGSGLQRTFHLRGIKLLQDGVPINQADGGGDFQAVEPLSLQYTEVFRGANALQYGGTTLGGAINFVSPTGYDADLIQARFELGSFNYLREQISSGEVWGPFDYYVSLSEYRTDGFRNHSNQWNQRLFSNYGIKLTENVETRFYVSLVDSKSKLPGSLTKAQMRQNPKQPNDSSATANLRGNNKRDFDLVRIANKTTVNWDDQKVEVGSYFVYKDLFHPIFQVLDVITEDFGGMIRYLNENPIFEHRNLFLIGINPVWGLATDNRYTNVGGERGVRTAHSRQRSWNLELFTENQFYAFSRLAVVTGLQWSIASREVRDRFTSDGDNSAHPVYKEVTPKVGLRYELTETSQIYTNFSRSFEPPSFGELTNVAGGRVLSLNAQTASTVEIGTRGEEGRFSWDLAYYYAWLENELLGLVDGFGNPLGTINAYGTRHQGLEFGGGVDVLSDLIKEEDRINLRALYNWSRFRFSNDPIFNDNPLPGIPEHFMRLELQYEHPFGIYFGPNLEWNLKRYPVDMNNTLFSGRYALLGLKAGYRVKKGLSIFIEAKNLTNKIYAATTGVIANANGADSAQFLPGDGRSVYSGVEFRWG